MVLGFASFVCTIGEEAALGGPILSGIGLSGSDRDERDSNLLDISREAVVSNNEVEKFDTNWLKTVNNGAVADFFVFKRAELLLKSSHLTLKPNLTVWNTGISEIQVLFNANG